MADFGALEFPGDPGHQGYVERVGGGRDACQPQRGLTDSPSIRPWRLGSPATLRYPCFAADRPRHASAFVAVQLSRPRRRPPATCGRQAGAAGTFRAVRSVDGVGWARRWRTRLLDQSRCRVVAARGSCEVAIGGESGFPAARATDRYSPTSVLSALAIDAIRSRECGDRRRPTQRALRSSRINSTAGVPSLPSGRRNSCNGGSARGVRGTPTSLATALPWRGA